MESNVLLKNYNCFMDLRKKLFLLIILILQCSMAFQIKIFSFDILLRDNQLTDEQDLKDNSSFIHINTIFPYNIYEKISRGSLIPESKNYYFAKIQYSQVSTSFEMQFHSVLNASEYQIMYRRLPEVIFFEAGSSQYLQFIKKDPTLGNSNFIIKNSTYENYKKKESQYSLNFFSLRIDKYLEKCARIAQKQLKSKLNEQSLLKFLNLTKYTEDGIKTNASERNEAILLHFFDRDIYYQRVMAGEIINQLLIVNITESTLWDMKYDGFGFRFFSAKMLTNNIRNADNNTFLEQKTVQLSIIGSDKTKNTRAQKIKQPIQYLKLQNIAKLQLCLQGQRIHLLLGDSSSFYLIDVSTSLWNLDAYKTNVKFELMFDDQCRLLYVQQKQIKYVNFASKSQLERHNINDTNNLQTNIKDKQINNLKEEENRTNLNSSIKIDSIDKENGRKIIPKTNYPIIRQIVKVQLKGTITSIHKLHSYTIICQNYNETSQECFLYKKNLNFPHLKSLILQSGKHIQWSQYRKIQNNSIIHIISYRIKQTNLRQPIQVYLEPIIKTKQNQTYSQIFGFVFPFQVYLNKSICREHQMDKMVFNHLQTLNLQKNYHNPLIPDNFYEFSLLLSKDQRVCYNLTQNESQQIINMQPDSNWTICPIKQVTKGSSQINIVSHSSLYKMFMCQTSLDNYSDSNYKCFPYNTQQNPKNKHLLNGNILIKFYMLRLESQKRFPILSFTDIDKQQIIFASNVFFILMLVLSISFLLLVLFVVLKPIVVAVFIYYGWRQDFSLPTYPLTWIQLKIKIKRLVQMKFLKYVPHDPIIETQDNHCCFCLENLLKGNNVAQLYCRHQFHKECFDQWVKNEPNLRCPTCRRQFTRQNLSEFQSSQQLLPN